MSPPRTLYSRSTTSARTRASTSPFLTKKNGRKFYNTSTFTLPTLLDDPKHVRQNLVACIGEFSDDAQDVFERFKFVDRVAAA